MVQGNTQAVVLQPSKGQHVTLDLNHSTDTTAISSFENSANVAVSAFDYATGIAVFLALCATGLAYWFGVRSFVLTKQSFEAVIRQIQSSEALMAKSNRDLIESQEKLKKWT